MLSNLYYRTLRSTGITSLARRLRQGALVLCYHNVIPEREAPAGDQALHLSIDRFRDQIAWLKEHYTVAPLRDIVARIEAGDSVRGLAAITFDDGYAGTFAYAWPLLRDLGLPATMFIVAGAPARQGGTLFWWDHPEIVRSNSPAARNRRLVSLRGDAALIVADAGAGPVAPMPLTHQPADWSLIAREAAAGLDIGAHTISHRTLTTLDDTELYAEVAAPAGIILEHTGVDPAFFSYPYGIWNARVRDAVRHAGYRAAVTLDFGLNPVGTDLCELRRINVPASISKPAFAGWTAGIRPRSAAA